MFILASMNGQAYSKLKLQIENENSTISVQQEQTHMPTEALPIDNYPLGDVYDSTNREQLSYKHAPKNQEHMSVGHAVQVTATGYSAGYESTGKTPDHPAFGITYSGIQVVRDESALSTIAADLDVFPIGTVLFIPGYGYGVVADIGGLIKGDKIDLYFDTKDQVYQEWGKKILQVFVIKKGNGKVNKRIWNQLKEEILAQTQHI